MGVAANAVMVATTDVDVRKVPNPDGLLTDEVMGVPTVGVGVPVTGNAGAMPGVAMLGAGARGVALAAPAAGNVAVGFGGNVGEGAMVAACTAIGVIGVFVAASVPAGNGV